jgi:hypothetical protein
MLSYEHICKTFNPGTPDAVTLFDDFNLTVDDGEFVSIIGSNGSGKTTMLNLLCGSLPVDSGKIIVDGNDITHLAEYRRAAHIGRVFQDPKAGTCSDLTILENMALADNKKRRYGLTPAVSRARIDAYREMLAQCGMGLEERLHTKVGTLSGGQRQALALVIANMTDIDLLILDEHTAALDPKSADTVMQLTDKFVRASQITTMMVTHNLRFAVEYGTRLIMMHEGKCIVDIRGEEKKKANVDDLLNIFYEISIEVGN